MERHEFPVRGEAEQWVEAAERGDEVVLTRDGKPVAFVEAAKPVEYTPDILALLKVREALAPLRYAGAGNLIREQRDASAH